MELTGQVYKSTGSWYQVKLDKGNMIQARMKGVFKLDNITSTNPIAVGDSVMVETDNEDENNYVITEIFARKNYVVRISPRQKNHIHIIAANIDQAVIIATIKNPRTSIGFIDRFLTVCEMQHIPPLIIFNKSDTYQQKEISMFEEFRSIYSSLGYSVLLTSFKNKVGKTDTESLLDGKLSLVFGHSGVGKSSLINLLHPGLMLKTTEVSDWSGKGLHTTTFTSIYELNANTKIIDTPGIRELGIFDADETDLGGYFPEFRDRMHQCKFNNCRHVNESDCAVKDAVECGEIHYKRYESYIGILMSLGEE